MTSNSTWRARATIVATIVCFPALILGTSGCIYSGDYLELCDWEAEIDVSEHVAGLGGEWRELNSDNPLSFYRLFMDDGSRPRHWQSVRPESLDNNYGLHPGGGTFYGCGGVSHRALVLLDPNRGGLGGLSTGNMLIDVAPYEDGQGYVLTHNSSSDPSDLLNEYSNQTLTYIHQVDENTLRFAQMGPDGIFDDKARTLTRYSDEFPDYLEDLLGAPDGHLP